MFVDKATVTVLRQGRDGAVSFHREKIYCPGGPDGGDGGKGGDIVLVVDDSMSRLWTPVQEKIRRTKRRERRRPNVHRP